MGKSGYFNCLTFHISMFDALFMLYVEFLLNNGRMSVEPNGRIAEYHKMRFQAEYFPCSDWLILVLIALETVFCGKKYLQNSVPEVYPWS